MFLGYNQTYISELSQCQTGRMGPKSKTPKSAKVTKVTCRHCGSSQPQITRQYYPEYLVKVHQDTTGDLSEYGQQMISFVRNNKTEEGAKGAAAGAQKTAAGQQSIFLWLA